MKNAIMAVVFMGLPLFISCSAIAAAIELYVIMDDETASLWLNITCLASVVYLITYAFEIVRLCVVERKRKSKKEEDK